MSDYKVSIMRFDDLKEDEKLWQPDNGSGKDCAQYLKIEFKGETIAIESDAMEPEDVRFSRDLNWIKSALEKAYKLGKSNEQRDNLDFGEAVCFIKDGFVVTNDDWNGKEMELTLELVAILRDGGETIGETNDEFVLKTPRGKKAIGWRPSKNDILSTKWRVVGEPD